MYSGVYELLESIGWIEEFKSQKKRVLNLLGNMPHRAEGIKGISICCQI